mmetsp:Transcript_13684/g.38754  ORF Transcript_13684/g.38754 Transcript_13684/m.38754 type:complete len:246 (-) Transcript_13684:110-847(-)
MGDKHLPKEAVKRLQKEYKNILKEPPPHISAHPSPNNLLEWHYVLQGSGDYAGGVYHGKIIFPSTYPFKPPAIKMLTPSGRFATNTRLCLSMSDFHPETWNPMWSVTSILTGLLSFMQDELPTAGSIKASKSERRRLAKESLAWNLKNPTFRKLFPEWEEKHQKLQAEASGDEVADEDGSPQDSELAASQGAEEKAAAANSRQAPPPAAGGAASSLSTSQLMWVAAFIAGAGVVLAIPFMSFSVS